MTVGGHDVTRGTDPPCVKKGDAPNVVVVFVRRFSAATTRTGGRGGGGITSVYRSGSGCDDTSSGVATTRFRIDRGAHCISILTPAAARRRRRFG